MIQINAYLSFPGNCREAMEFYQKCFGGELTLQTVEDSPMADQWPAQVQQNILHATLLKDSMMLMASDMGGPGELIRGNTVSLSLTCSNLMEIKSCYAYLAAGGQRTRPLHEFFGGTIGMLTDRYGMNWLLYYGQPSDN
jgi:PhnB protein